MARWTRAGWLSAAEQDRLRRHGPYRTDSTFNSWCFGPGIADDIRDKIPCYACGEIGTEGALNGAGPGYWTLAAPKYEPHGLLRLCEKHKPYIWGSVKAYEALEKMHRGCLVKGVRGVEYYHPPPL